MANSPMTPGIAAARLPEEALEANFADLHPPLDGHEAAVAADRCYFCYDCALHHRLPHGHRHSALHPPDRRRQSRECRRDNP